MRNRILLLLLSLVFALPVAAQPVVTVTIPDFSALPGETVDIPVQLSDVTGLDISSFTVIMEFNSTVLSITGITYGPIALSAGPGGGEPLCSGLPDIPGCFSIANTSLPPQARVTHATGGIALAGAGVLLTYRAEMLSVGDAGLNFTTFSLRGGSIPVQIVGGNATVNNRPFATNGTLELDEDTPGEVTLMATDVDGDPLEYEVVTPPVNGTVAITGDVARYTPAGNYAGGDQFAFRANDGTDNSNTATVMVTVNPVNDAPVFTAALGDSRIREGELLEFNYAAADIENDALTFSLLNSVTGAGLDPATGVFSWTPSSEQAGEYTIQASVSDGTAQGISAAATITVVDAETHAGDLSPANLVSPVRSGGRGTLEAAYVPEDNLLIVSAAFEGLTSPRSGAKLYLGDFGQVGTAILPLVVSVNPGNPGSSNGLVSPTVNSFDLTSAALPTGVAAADVVQALRDGRLYVVIESQNHLVGEIRAHLRPSPGNLGPESPSLTIPSSVMIEGEPGATAMTASWSVVTDPQGDAVRYVLGLWADAARTQAVRLYDGAGAFDRSFTTNTLARLFDQQSGRQEVDLNIGGTESLFAAVVATDGSSITLSNIEPIDLVRGLVTATEDDDLVPETFMLRGNFPNPFNPTTTIQFDLPEPADVTVRITDLLGREALSVPPGPMEAGMMRSIPIDAGELASGIYIYRVTATAGRSVYVATGTMTLLK